MARVEKNTRTPLGTRLPSSDRTPRAKAISVAIGIAQPCIAPPLLNRAYTHAGTTTPPTAASMGSRAWRGRRSSPTVISYFSSIPTSRKKIAIKKSFTKSSTDIDAVKEPMPTWMGSVRKWWIAS